MWDLSLMVSSGARSASGDRTVCLKAVELGLQGGVARLERGPARAHQPFTLHWAQYFTALNSEANFEGVWRKGTNLTNGENR